MDSSRSRAAQCSSLSFSLCLECEPFRICASVGRMPRGSVVLARVTGALQPIYIAITLAASRTQDQKKPPEGGFSNRWGTSTKAEDHRCQHQMKQGSGGVGSNLKPGGRGCGLSPPDASSSSCSLSSLFAPRRSSLPSLPCCCEPRRIPEAPTQRHSRGDTGLTVLAGRY